MTIGVIGLGAIGQFVTDRLVADGHHISAVLVRPQRLTNDDCAANWVATAADVPEHTRLMVDCAGHQALAQHGPPLLRRGIDLVTVSIGALADPDLSARLHRATEQGGGRLHLASGAIGALDCLQAARVGRLDSVTYIGRKPPPGWKGSAAENCIDLDHLTEATIHFSGNARDAALTYPKNANVAAAVALAGIGFEQTTVQLIADPGCDGNTHVVEAYGDFGRFSFELHGRSLPDNPRSSALAAMSVVGRLHQLNQRVGF